MSDTDGLGLSAPRTARVASAVAFAVGVLGLLAWLLGMPALGSLHAGWIGMAPTTAVAILLLAISVWPAGAGRFRRAPRAQKVLALIAGAVGLLALSPYVAGPDVALDEVLRRQLAGAARMAPTTGLACALLGGARMVADGDGEVSRALSDLLSGLAGLLVSSILVAYSFGVVPVAAGPGATPMAVPTGIALLALTVASMAGSPGSRARKVLSSPLPGGVVARWLLPVLGVAILLIAWGAHLAVHAGDLSDATGDALQTMSSLVLLGAIVLWSATRLDQREAARTRTADLLRRSTEDYSSLIEHSPLGIYRSSPDGRFLRVNPALVRMLGYTAPEEVLALDMARDVYTDPHVHHQFVNRFRHAGPGVSETEWKCKDGTRITVRLNVRVLPGPGGEPEAYEGVVEDVTAQHSLEAQMRQAQRLEAVGRLAGGVAHDFNNVLTAVTGYADLLMEDLDPGDPKRDDVEEIRAAAQRAAALTRQLLAFSRKQVLQARVLDLNAVVRGLDRMLKRVIGEDVRLELTLAPELGQVRADPGQLEQVIVNLAVNSRDAMPRGGRLIIETANAELDETYVGGHAGAAPGPHVMLAVTDTGIGMDAETRSHLFEPFFTTKGPGTGTGLGLSTVYGIVKQSGGSVWVYSEPGRGATFKIYLPRVSGPVEAPDRPSVAGGPTGGHETVLLAEDDPGVREVVSDTLAGNGYRVLRAPDGQAALEMARAHAGVIHLLLTDLVMPGLSGRELAEALAAERPGLRTLYMSGYTDDGVVRQAVLEAGMPYLQKPFAPAALAIKVREVLDAPASARP